MLKVLVMSRVGASDYFVQPSTRVVETRESDVQTHTESGFHHFGGRHIDFHSFAGDFSLTLT